MHLPSSKHLDSVNLTRTGAAQTQQHLRLRILLGGQYQRLYGSSTAYAAMAPVSSSLLRAGLEEQWRLRIERANGLHHSAGS
jgi:hypothetical protein